MKSRGTRTRKTYHSLAELPKTYVPLEVAKRTLARDAAWFEKHLGPDVPRVARPQRHEAGVVDAHLDVGVDGLRLSTRNANCLRRAGIRTLRDLTRRTEREMLYIRHLGRKCLSELREVLREEGLAFASEPVAAIPDVAFELERLSARVAELERVLACGDADRPLTFEETVARATTRSAATVRGWLARPARRREYLLDILFSKDVTGRWTSTPRRVAAWQRAIAVKWGR
jgi:hypothetical protein